MSLAKTEIRELNRVISSLKKIVAQVSKTKTTPSKATAKSRRRMRRSGKELTEFRKMLVAERKKGVPVAALAKRHGISTAYIYQL